MSRRGLNLVLREETALRRHLCLIQMLSTRRFGLTVEEMAQEAGVTKKTIRRDLDLFRAVGLNLEETTEEYGRKTWKALNNKIALALNPDEAMALYLGKRLMTPLAATPFGLAAWEAFRKLRATLSPGALEYLDRFAELYHISEVGLGFNRYQGKEDLIDQLRTAVEDGLVTHILYQSDRATEPASRDIYPLALLDHRRALYLVAIDPRAKPPGYRHYKVVRIEEVELTPLKFQRPVDFNIKDYFKSAMGVFRGEQTIRIKVRFAPSVARYVQETPIHHAERHTQERDGSLISVYELSSTVEFKSWILSFGSKAEVLEPSSLRLELLEEIRAMLARYEASSARRPPPAPNESGQTGRSFNEKRANHPPLGS